MSKEDTSKRLLTIEESLKRSLVGQDEAITAVSRVLRRAGAGLRSAMKNKLPIASFVFVGPSGVGKTELAKLIAAVYFGSEEAMLRFDMNEFTKDHDSVGKILTRISNMFGFRPSNVLLFDHIEEAHDHFLNVLLEILNNGVYCTAPGPIGTYRIYNFSDTIIILKSTDIGRLRGTCGPEERRKEAGKRVNEVFSADIVSRVDEILVFEQLLECHWSKILEVLLVDFYRIGGNLRVGISSSLKKLLISNGCNASNGAKQLRGEIIRLLEDNLAMKILDGTVTPTQNQAVQMDLDDKGNVTMTIEP